MSGSGVFISSLPRRAALKMALTAATSFAPLAETRSASVSRGVHA